MSIQQQCSDNFIQIGGGVTFRIQLSLLGMMTTEMSDCWFGKRTAGEGLE